MTTVKPTGKTPVGFKHLVIVKDYFDNGKLQPMVKTNEVMAWLKKDFDLSHVHSLAIYYTYNEAAK